MTLKYRRAPLILGIVLMIALSASLLLFRSSPGDLAAPHMAVAGSSFIGNCRKCHTSKGLTAGCLSCHTEIDAQLAGRKGYHGLVLAGKAQNCASCHSDHNGKDFALVNRVSWAGAEPAQFKHTYAEFTLKAAHDKLACADCHVKRAPPFSLPRFPKIRRPATFLGLKQDCVFCHKDIHGGGQADACAKCHSQDKWKPAPGFDHDKSYPLRDAHAKVACAKCHAPGPPPEGKIFGRIAGKKCADCHKTPHLARWNTGCEVCHTGNAVPWETANLRLTRAQHQAAGFSIEKPHAKTACKACHDPAKPYAQRYSQAGAPGRPRAQKACEVCHKDEHAGQFLPARPRCLDCHKETEFKPTAFAVKDHTSWPLNGGHKKAACAACHIRDAALGTVRFVKVRRDCAFCHKDPHAGQFRTGGKTVCESCHRDELSWKKIIFTHDTMSRFKLDKAHSGVACKECHPPALTPEGRKVTLYKPLKSACEDCHAVPR